MDTEGRSFSALVKKMRRQLALSQEDLARQLGVSYATVNRWENGQSLPSKLAKAQLKAFCEKMIERGKLTLSGDMIDFADLGTAAGDEKGDREAFDPVRSLRAGIVGADLKPRHNRRSIRLQGYDYSGAGAYFVTVCTHNRACLFGDIEDGQMVLNDAGKIVTDEWMKSGEIRNEIELGEWVVMPNHFHGIVIIRRGDRPVATMPGPRPKSIGSLMSGFKSAVTKRINEMRNTPGAKLWQRNYYEHVIRNDDELHRIREYIPNNPVRWEDAAARRAFRGAGADH